MNCHTSSLLSAAACLTLGTLAFAGDLSSAGLVVLNQTADGALSMSGSSEIRVPAATVYVNSSSNNAITTNGTATLDTPELKIVGTPRFAGNSGCTGDVIRVPIAFADPLNPFAVPAPGSMPDRGGINISSNATVTLQPGRYSDGIRVTGNANITLAPGTYLVEDGLDIRSGSIVGDGVTVIVTSGSFRISGTSRCELSAPSVGSMAGLVLAMAPDNTAEMTLVGGSEVDIQGTLYARASLLNLRGNSTVEGEGPTMGDLVIADRVSLAGTGSIRIGHDAMPAVRLPSLPLFD